MQSPALPCFLFEACRNTNNYNQQPEEEDNDFDGEEPRPAFDEEDFMFQQPQDEPLMVFSQEIDKGGESDNTTVTAEVSEPQRWRCHAHAIETSLEILVKAESAFSEIDACATFAGTQYSFIPGEKTPVIMR